MASIVLVLTQIHANCGKTAHNQHSSLIIQPRIKMCKNKERPATPSYIKKYEGNIYPQLDNEKRRIVHTCIDTAPLLICNCLVHETV